MQIIFLGGTDPQESVVYHCFGLCCPPSTIMPIWPNQTEKRGCQQQKKMRGPTQSVDNDISAWSTDDDPNHNLDGFASATSAHLPVEEGAVYQNCASDAAADECPDEQNFSSQDELDDEEEELPISDSAMTMPSNAAAERRAARRLLRGVKIWFESSLRDVVVINAKELGLAVVRSACDADILWVETPEPSLFATSSFRQRPSALKPHQKINCYPGMKRLATKCEFAKVVNRMRLACASTSNANLFDFVPKTYALPSDRLCLDQDAAACAKQIFVVKPDGGCGGDGIYLTDDLRSVRTSECVVQEYLSTPLLLQGLKFDLRLYVLVTSLEPLRYYVCREGLCRMAVEPYETPSKKNFHKLNMHLTNYSLNKFSSSFVENTDAYNDELCSKRRVSTAFRQLSALYPDFVEDNFWQEMDVIVHATLTALLPSLQLAAFDASFSSSRPDFQQNSNNCFHLIGFDILVDRKYHLHLLEINHHPSLQADAPVDMYVKTEVLRPLWKMVAYDALCHRHLTGGGTNDKKKKKSSAIAQLLATTTKTEWEERWRGLYGIAQANNSLLVAAIRPFLVLKDLYLVACSVGSSIPKLEVGKGKMLKLVRSLGWVGDAVTCPFRSSSEVDLLVIKRLGTRSNTSASFDFEEFIVFILDDVGRLLLPPQALDKSWCFRQAHLSSMAALLSREAIPSSLDD